MLYTRSIWAPLSGSVASLRAAEQEERHRRKLRRLSSGSAGNVLNLPFQGWFLPSAQRVQERLPIFVTYGYVFP